MRVLISCYMIITLLYAVFGTFAWFLGMTSVPLLAIWIWWLIPRLVLLLIELKHL